jgi:putative transposase
MTVRGVVRARTALHLEILALRHQLQVLQRSHRPRLRLANVDRWLWAWLSTAWTEWRTALVIVKPATVVAWHRQRFRLFWTWRSRRRTGRPPVSADVRGLIRAMSQEKPAVGRATHSRRALEVGPARVSDDGCELPAALDHDHAAVSVMAHIAY